MRKVYMPNPIYKIQWILLIILFYICINLMGGPHHSLLNDKKGICKWGANAFLLETRGSLENSSFQPCTWNIMNPSKSRKEKSAFEKENVIHWQYTKQAVPIFMFIRSIMYHCTKTCLKHVLKLDPHFPPMKSFVIAVLFNTIGKA